MLNNLGRVEATPSTFQTGMGPINFPNFQFVLVSFLVHHLATKCEGCNSSPSIDVSGKKLVTLGNEYIKSKKEIATKNLLIVNITVRS